MINVNKAFEDEFLKGQKDCKKGVKEPNRSDAYYRGHKTEQEAVKAREGAKNECRTQPN